MAYTLKDVVDVLGDPENTRSRLGNIPSQIDPHKP
jgi:hypothetical protein